MSHKIISGIILLVVAFFVYDFFFKPPSFKSGAAAPDFSTALITGNEFTLSDLRGKYVLLDFWGSWCGPCIKEIPELKSLYNSFHGKSFRDASNFEIVSIALEKSDAFTKRIIDQRGLDWDYHIIETSKIVLMSSLAQNYNVKELPTKFLINPKGEIMGTNLSFDAMNQMLSERLK